MKISVNKYTLEPEVVNGGTAGSHGMESLEFDFSPEWDGLCRAVTFFPPKSVAKCVSFVGSTVPLPAEVTKRSGRTSYVLCGARDGMAVITLTGVIKVEESLIPDEAQITENTPGALEQAALLCEEARQSALRASSAAGAVSMAMDKTAQMVEAVTTAHEFINEKYEQVKSGTAVHPSVTDGNSSDSSHSVSVKGMLGYLNALLKAVCPLRVKVVNTIPSAPAADTVYIVNGEPMAYITGGNATLYEWAPTYIGGGGPAVLFTRGTGIGVGTELYWCGAAEMTSIDQLTLYDTVSSVSDGVYTTSQYGTLSAEFVKAVTVTDPGAEASLRKLTSADDLTPYLMDNPARWLITGGAA